MFDSQQLNIVLKTVADTTGAKQVTQALTQVKQAAQAAQPNLSPQVEFANDLVKRLTAAHGQSLDAFNAAQATVKKSTGVAPTVTAADLGITQAALAQVKQVVQAAQPAQTPQAVQPVPPAQTAQATQAAQTKLSPQVEFANDLVKRLTATHGGTPAAFTSALDTVKKSTGVAPTISAADLGIVQQAAVKTTAAVSGTTTATKAVVAATHEHAAAQKDSGEATQTNEVHLLRFGAALFGVSTGLSLFTAAGNLIKNVVSGIVQTEVAAQQATRELAAAYGGASAEQARFAAQLSKGKEAFGVTEIEQATLALRPLGEQFQFTRAQMQDLVAAAAHLADIHEIPLADAAKALDAAIRGNSSSADALGLSLSTVQVAQRGMAEGTAGTFPSLTQQQKALLTLAVALKEVKDLQDRTASSAVPLSREARATATAVAALNGVFAGGAVSALGSMAAAMATWVNGLKDLGKASDATLRPLGELNFRVDEIAAATGVTVPKLANAVDDIAKSAGNLGRAGPPTPTLTRFMSDLATEAGTAQSRLSELQGVMLNVADSGAALSQATARSRAEIALLAKETANQRGGGLSDQLNVALQQAQTDAERQQIQARIDGLGRLEAAFNALGTVERTQADLQRQSIILTAAEASAQIAALPATNRLTDVTDRIARDRLVAQDRTGQNIDARSAARREGRLLTRQVLPGAELSAFDAARPGELAARDVRANALAGQVLSGSAALAQRRVDVVLGGSIDVNLGGSANLTDVQIKDLAQQAGSQVYDRIVADFSKARRDAEGGAPPSLAGSR